MVQETRLVGEACYPVLASVIKRNMTVYSISEAHLGMQRAWQVLQTYTFKMANAKLLYGDT